MEEEISIRELIEIILKGKWIIIGITITALLISGVVSFYVLEPTYEAKAVLAIEKYIIPVQVQTTSGPEGLVNSALISEASPKSFISLANTVDTLEKVMDKLHIDGQKIPLNVLANKINVQNVKDTDLLEIIVRDTETQRTANIANELADQLTEAALIEINDNRSKTMAFLQAQAKSEHAIIERCQAEIKEFLQQPDSVVELETELNTSLQLLSDFQTRERILQIEIKKANTMIESIENQLVDIPSKIEMRGQELTSEELNPVYFELNKQLELNKALIAQLTVEEGLILEEKAVISETINDLQIALADKKTKLEQLQLNLTVAQENYLMFNRKQEEIRYIETLNSDKAPLKIVSRASEPQVPVAPNKMLNMAVAGCIGLMIGAFVVLFRSHWVNSATNSKAY